MEVLRIEFSREATFLSRSWGAEAQGSRGAGEQGCVGDRPAHGVAV